MIGRKWAHEARRRLCQLCANRINAERIRETISAQQADVDEMAVENLIAGYRIPATRAERQEAVARLIRKGLSGPAIAIRLGITERSVDRLRRRVREAA